MKILKVLNGVVAVLLSFGVVFLSGYLIGRTGKHNPKKDISYDTIYVDRPIPVRDTVYVERGKDSLRIDTLIISTPTSDTVYINDTVYIKIPIPIAQIEACGKYYRAYISGFRPVLDSIFITVPEKIIYKNELRYLVPTWEIAIFGSGGYLGKHADIMVGLSGRYNTGPLYGQFNIGYGLGTKSPYALATVGWRIWKRQ